MGEELADFGTCYKITFWADNGNDPKKAAKEIIKKIRVIKKYSKPPKFLDEGVVKAVGALLNTFNDDIESIIKHRDFYNSTKILIWNPPTDILYMIAEKDKNSTFNYSNVTNLFSSFYEKQVSKKLGLRFTDEEKSHCRGCWNDTYSTSVGRCYKCGHRKQILSDEQLAKNRKLYGEALESLRKAS